MNNKLIIAGTGLGIWEGTTLVNADGNISGNIVCEIAK